MKKKNKKKRKGEDLISKGREGGKAKELTIASRESSPLLVLLANPKKGVEIASRESTLVLLISANAKNTYICQRTDSTRC